MIRLSGYRFERHELLKRLHKHIFLKFSCIIRRMVTITDIPDRDRIVVSSSDVKLLVIMSGDSGSKYPAIMTLPPLGTLIPLTKVVRGTPVFTVLHSCIF